MKRGPMETATLNLLKGSADYNTACAADKREVRKMLKEVRMLDQTVDPEIINFFAQLTDAVKGMRK